MVASTEILPSASIFLFLNYFAVFRTFVGVSDSGERKLNLIPRSSNIDASTINYLSPESFTAPGVFTKSNQQILRSIALKVQCERCSGI